MYVFVLTRDVSVRRRRHDAIDLCVCVCVCVCVCGLHGDFVLLLLLLPDAPE